MKALCIAAFMASIIPTIAAPSTAAQVKIHPVVDSPAQRDALRKFSQCVAGQRPRWARALLAQPYLSDAQTEAAAEVVTGQDHCLGRNETEMTFRTSTVVAALAEQFLRADLARADFGEVSRTLQTLEPSNAFEDFALCVAAQSPQSARDLALSEPGSPDEANAAKSMISRVAPCTRPGEQLQVDPQELRALVAAALYKATTATLGSAK